MARAASDAGSDQDFELVGHDVDEESPTAVSHVQGGITPHTRRYFEPNYAEISKESFCNVGCGIGMKCYSAHAFGNTCLLGEPIIGRDGCCQFMDLSVFVVTVAQMQRYAASNESAFNRPNDKVVSGFLLSSDTTQRLGNVLPRDLESPTSDGDDNIFARDGNGFLSLNFQKPAGRTLPYQAKMNLMFLFSRLFVNIMFFFPDTRFEITPSIREREDVFVVIRASSARDITDQTLTYASNVRVDLLDSAGSGLPANEMTPIVMERNRLNTPGTCVVNVKFEYSTPSDDDLLLIALERSRNRYNGRKYSIIVGARPSMIAKYRNGTHNGVSLYRSSAPPVAPSSPSPMGFTSIDQYEHVVRTDTYI